jgi:hypothetical protein
VTTTGEAVGAPTPMGSDLAAGVDALDNVQDVTFTRYVRLVLPLDGFVFWVREQMVAPSALMNRGLLNRFRLNQPPAIAGGAPTLTVKGSLHYATDIRQDVDELYATNRVVFTAEQEVNPFNTVVPGTMWIGTFQQPPRQDVTTPQGPPLRIAFSSQSSRYYQAGLWHYVGTAVLPDMLPQIVDSLSGFDQRQIVSNSLPAWLALNAYAPAFGFGLPGGLVLYPSFLTPFNEQPPYGGVHIDPAQTIALASAPLLTRTTSHEQLAADQVKITLWGLRNDEAMTFVDAIYQYSDMTDAIGIMNMPVVQDEKKTQAELQTLAQKKSVEFQVSYLQRSVRALAQQALKQSIIGFNVDVLAA